MARDGKARIAWIAACWLCYWLFVTGRLGKEPGLLIGFYARGPGRTLALGLPGHTNEPLALHTGHLIAESKHIGNTLFSISFSIFIQHFYALREIQVTAPSFEKSVPITYPLAISLYTSSIYSPALPAHGHLTRPRQPRPSA